VPVSNQDDLEALVRECQGGREADQAGPDDRNAGNGGIAEVGIATGPNRPAGAGAETAGTGFSY